MRIGRLRVTQAPARVPPTRRQEESHGREAASRGGLRFPQSAGIRHANSGPLRRDHGEVSWLDGLGLDLVWFTEHHFVADGYLPSWIPVASAMAARTRHVRFSCDVCLLPFNHPIRLAEDLAVLDNLSGGRVEIGVGMGYAPHEFRGFGLHPSWRASLTGGGPGG